jgi:glycerophosphodiester phosphodiesterase
LIEVYKLLGESNESFDDFHRENCDLLRVRQAELCVKYERAIKACAFSSDGTREFREARSFVKAATELREDFAKLQKYSRVNEDAIHRLYAKVERSNSCDTPAYEEQKSSWNISQIDRHRHSVNFLNRLDSLMSSIKETREVPEEMQLCSDNRDTSRQKQFLATKRPALYRAVSNDDPSTLAYLLRNLSRDPSLKLDRKSIVYEMAETAVSCDSQLCFENLLAKVFDIDGVVLDHELLNQIISMEGQSNDNGEKRDYSLFAFAYDYLVPRQTDALFTKDNCLRSSLHYGALYGLNSVCQPILKCAQGLGGGYASNLILSSDYHGFTAFHYAVIKDHMDIAITFLEILRLDNRSDEALCWNLNDLLIIALRYQHDDMVSLLVKSGFGPNSRSSHDETALYVACQIGREYYVKMLLEGGSDVDINTPETTHGWTPLFIACVEGFQSIVELLLQAGASQDELDHLGWNAKEHAALRGHLPVAEVLKSWDSNNLVGGPASLLRKPEPEICHPLSVRDHQVIVNLGILRNGEPVKAVDFDSWSKPILPSLEMSISVEDNTSQIMKLPLLSDMVNEPFVFHVAKPSEARLIFKFYSSEQSYEERQLVGSAAALLGSDKRCFGENRESLVRERTVPIFEKATMDLMGTVTFTSIIAKPLTCSNTSSSPKQDLERETLQIVGHRGICNSKSAESVTQRLLTNTEKDLVRTRPIAASCSWVKTRLRYLGSYFDYHP